MFIFLEVVLCSILRIPGCVMHSVLVKGGDLILGVVQYNIIFYLGGCTVQCVHVRQQYICVFAVPVIKNL